MRNRISVLLLVFVWAAVQPRSSLVGAQSTDCTPTTNGGTESDIQCTPSSPSMRKNVYWNITFPDGYVVPNFQVSDSGVCVYNVQSSCCGSSTMQSCWPDFQPPVLTSGMFSQTTYTEAAAYFTQSCTICADYNQMEDPPCRHDPDYLPHVQRTSHACSSGGCTEFEIIQCQNDLGILQPDCGCTTPIILDTSGAGFDLTNVTNGVNFDIAADGVDGRVAWTAPGSSNAFLCLDRNGNGMIDNGSELFGNVTPQPPSPHPNGFLALAVYDQPENGGNGDGKIDQNDAIYSKLSLWIDSNHNGISDPGELHSLPSLGIGAIYLNYQFSRWIDQYGNAFRYRAAVTPLPGFHPGPWTYDVVLLTQ